MKLIETSRELSPMEIYDMTKNPDIVPFKNAIGSRITVDCWAVYEDTNTTKDGNEETKQILTIKDEDGTVYAGNSPTFYREFMDIKELFNSMGCDLPALEIVSGVSKGGKEYVNVKAVA